MADVQKLPADPDRPLVSQLFKEGYLFDFFQAAWLLEQALPDGASPGTGPELSKERIRFRPHSGLAFPPTDIKAIDWLEEEEQARVTVTFWGLYGVDSPLPYYFFDGIAKETTEAEPLRMFLDLFDHRLYSFLYRAWKKYRPVTHKGGHKKNLHAHIFKSLAGMGTAGLARPPSLPLERLVAMAGQLMGRVRNAMGLEHLVTDALGGIIARVTENVPRWVPLRERPRMGARGAAGASLGTTAIVGQNLRDVSGKFRLSLGPINLAQYQSLLPGAPEAKTVEYMVRMYAPDYLDYEIELLLNAADVPPVRLGGKQRMGSDMWLGHPAGDVISILVDYT